MASQNREGSPLMKVRSSKKQSSANTTQSLSEALITTEQWNDFKKLGKAEALKVLRKAMSKGADVLTEETKDNLRANFPNAFVKGINKYKKYSDTVAEGVRASVYNPKGNTPWEAKVHILGTRKKTSGTFRLRFFEVGANGEKDKTGRVHKLKALHFFKDARDSKMNDVYRTINEAMNDMLPKKLEEILP